MIGDSMKNKNKRIKKTLGIITILSLIVLAFSWTTLNRLHAAITLFDKDKIVANFSHMKDAFITQELKAPAQPYKFSYDKQNLPEVFSYQNKKINTEEFLNRRATTAMVVVKNSDITFEEYYLGTTAQDKRISWSMAKSFVSVLMGIQVDANKVDIEAPVDFYLPQLKGSGYEHVKVKHVLQMSSGVKWNEDYADFNSDINKMGRLLAVGGSLDEMVTELEAETEPGKAFHYVSMDTHVISMIIREVTGKSLVELVQTQLWNKIGMEGDAQWITDSIGSAFALGGLNAQTRDYARFGQLLLNQGKWLDDTIVSDSWLTQATTAQVDYLAPNETELGYGYQIWLPTEAQQGEFFCVGVYGQFIYVNQQQGIVIVKNSADKGFMDGISKQETIAFFRAIVASLS